MKSGWVIKKLGEVCELIGGGTPSIHESSYYGGNIPWATVRDMNCRVIEKTERTITRKGLENSASNVIPAGNVIISTHVGLGKVCFVAQDTAINQDLKGVIPLADTIQRSFLYYWFLSIAEYLEKSGTGSTVRGVKLDFVKNLEFPVPSLPEQKRIVAKIDAAFEKIDKLKANAERNLKNAKELFQSALDEAMRPKKGWVEKRLGEVGPVCMCKRILKSETNESGGVPFYKIGTFGKTPNAYISEETYRRYRELYKFPRKGEILISAAGTIGRTVVYDGEPAYFQDSNIVWIANDETKVSNAYLQWYYKTSPWCVTKGATIPRLYNDNITSAAIAIPPIAEQRQIVKRLDFLAEKTKLLEHHYTRQIADCAEMRQAVLREAFEGRL